MTGIEDFNCLSQNAMVNNVMLDEDDINEELINNMLEEEKETYLIPMAIQVLLLN